MISTPEVFLPADDALIAMDYRFLLPGMKGCLRFIDSKFATDNQRSLSQLDIMEVPEEVLLKNCVLPLPLTMSDSHWQYFKGLITATSELLASHTSGAPLLKLLLQNRFAVDGNCKLSMASELYDHEDRIFISAFRNKSNSIFVHDNIRSFRSFWLKLGLRQRSNQGLDPKHFIICLQELKLRINNVAPQNDPHLVDDSQTILAPLTTQAFHNQRFSPGDWQIIAEEKVFKTRTTFGSEPPYRWNTMETLSVEKQVLCLREMVSSTFVGICWSQIPFALYEPSTESLRRISRNGGPALTMVWKHLKFLGELSQRLKGTEITDFVTDLQATYNYLQDHCEDSRAVFHGDLRTSLIWLNLDTYRPGDLVLDDITSSWQSIEQLVLSSSVDAGMIKAVKPGLMRYEKLLRALGCSAITYPTVNRPTLHHASSISKSLRQLRKDGKLLDVAYSTEGKLIQAHRVVLAAVSEKCALQFSGRWAVEDVIKYDETDDPDDFFSYHTLSNMINYVYEDEINWKEMEVTDTDDADSKDHKLDLLLELHRGADCWQMPALMSEVEDKILVAGRAFINLDNVLEIQERSDRAGAQAVKQMCAEFINQNRVVVEKAHSEN